MLVRELQPNKAFHTSNLNEEKFISPKHPSKCILPNIGEMVVSSSPSLFLFHFHLLEEVINEHKDFILGSWRD